MAKVEQVEDLFGMRIDQFARLTDEEKVAQQDAYMREYGPKMWADQAFIGILSRVSLGLGSGDLNSALRSQLMRQRLGLPQRGDMTNFGGDD